MRDEKYTNHFKFMSKEKRPLERSNCRWKRLKMVIKEMAIRV
jgi:hypothetical protein